MFTTTFGDSEIIVRVSRWGSSDPHATFLWNGRRIEFHIRPSDLDAIYAFPALYRIHPMDGSTVEGTADHYLQVWKDIFTYAHQIKVTYPTSMIEYCDWYEDTVLNPTNYVEIIQLTACKCINRADWQSCPFNPPTFHK